MIEKHEKGRRNRAVSTNGRAGSSEKNQLAHTQIFTVLDNLEAIIYVADMRTHEILYINQYTREIFGDITGEICWRSLQSGQSGPCTFCTNEKLLDEQGKPTDPCVWEFRNTVTDRWFNIVDKAIEWPDGRIVRLEIATDITAGKQAEEHLGEQVRLLSLTCAISSIVTRESDLGRMLQSACEAVVENTGTLFTRVWTLEPGDTILRLQASAGKYTALDGYHSRKPLDDSNKIGSIAINAGPKLTNAVTGDPQIINQQWVKEEGIAAFAGYPLIVDGRVVGVLAMFSRVVIPDTSLELLGAVAGEIALGIVRKKAEDSTRAETARAQKYLDIARVMMLALDVKGNITLINKKGQEILGYEEDELLGKNWFDTALPEPIAVEVKKTFFSLIQGKAEPFEYFENQVLAKDGEHKTIAWHNTLLYDEKGIIKGILSSGEDISDRLRIESELRQAQKMEAIGTLAGGIAHDFNNILSAILGYADMARETVPAGTQLHSDIEEIMQAGFRARDLVKQILAFSRQTEQENKIVAVHLVIREALNLLRATIPATIEIREDIPDCGAIIADPIQIHQVIMNLCTNAYQAMREQGSGILRIRLDTVVLEDQDLMELMELEPGEYVRLGISDTGHGMDRQTRERIFDPYFTTRAQKGGTGLGMSVVHGIISSLKGKITVYSEIGKGTIFHIYLPRLGSSDTRANAKGIRELPMGKEHLLVVEDEKILARMMEEMLTSLGYTVTVFTDSNAARHHFHSQPMDVDLVITDMTMPGVTGAELAREFLDRRPDLPIILCTGFSEFINEQEAMEIGIREFILKPIIKKDIAAAVRKVLDQTGNRPEKGTANVPVRE